MPTRPAPPAAVERQPKVFSEFGHTREDPYFWLREKGNPRVREIVEAENAYFAEVAQQWSGKKERAFEGLKSLIEPEATEAPYSLGKYWYGTRTPEGKEHPIYYRKASFDAKEETVLLDVNALAEKHEYVEVGAFAVSWDERAIAYSLDTNGSEHCAVFLKDLDDGTTRDLGIAHSSGDVVWSKDQGYLFFAELNDQDRPDRVFRYRLADGEKTLVYAEPDARFFISMGYTSDEKYLVVDCGAKESTEILLLPLDRPLEPLASFRPREENHRYEVESQGDRFLVLSNKEEINFKLYSFAPLPGAPGASTAAGATPPWGASHDLKNWKRLLSGDRAKHLVDLCVFRDVYAVHSTEKGSPQIDLYSRDHKHLHRVSFPEAVYNAGFHQNVRFDAESVRILYNSMKTPPQTWEIDLRSFAAKIVHRKNIPGYDPSLYEAERRFAKAEDGTEIPLSLFYRKDGANAPMPTVLYGYGAYGHPSSPRFSATQTYLADRGFLYVVAHVRGGGDLGEYWYREGKFQKKRNSFTDLVAAAEWLVREGRARKREISLYGGSAGGLLVGATMNLRPDLFRAVVAVVPFVDVMNTMLDETLPLTPTEWDEWGDPRKEEFYHAMLAYSPYDNVEAKAYPDVFMVCGWNDPRVTYWEPLKFAKRLRDLRTDDGLTLLHTQMGAGHGGSSGRFEYLKEIAEICAFLEWEYGI